VGAGGDKRNERDEREKGGEVGVMKGRRRLKKDGRGKKGGGRVEWEWE